MRAYACMCVCVCIIRLELKHKGWDKINFRKSSLIMPKANRKELRKALFKKGSSARAEAKKESKEKHVEIEATKPPPPVQQKKYILFVGNLPYDVKEEQIKDHFKSCKISSLRMRPNGICFLEFIGDNASQELHHALKFHHTNLGNRKINVELSAGGGGNSKNRREKIKKKNLDYQDEQKNKQKNQEGHSERDSQRGGGRRTKFEQTPAAPVSIDEANAAGINPARLAALRKH